MHFSIIKILGTPKHADMVSSTNALGRGKPSWTEEREWPCKRCDKNIKGISDFVEHLDTIHPNQCGIVCPICDKELPSKRRLKIHVVIHSDKKATCPVSRKSVFFYSILKLADKLYYSRTIVGLIFIFLYFSNDCFIVVLVLSFRV
jgi:hypothetical protein